MTRFPDSLFYLSAASAQVWSTLMVFHILLIRDLKHQIEREIDRLWSDAKIWWPELLLSMKSEQGLKSRLAEFGLTTETVLRADTHKDSFIRLIAAIKAHRIVSEHLSKVGPWENQQLTPDEWQLKFEPIAERIQELEMQRPETKSAFKLGMVGVAVNMTACALGGFTGAWYTPALILLLLTVNILVLYRFGSQVKTALGHFQVTSRHHPLTEQILSSKPRSPG